LCGYIKKILTSVKKVYYFDMCKNGLLFDMCTRVSVRMAYYFDM